MPDVTVSGSAQGNGTGNAKPKVNYALVTLETIRKFLEFKVSFTDKDDLLESLIEDTRGLFQNETDRRLLKTAYVGEEIYHDGSGIDIIWLKQFPVISVQRVNVGFGSGDLDPDDFAVYPEGYIRLKRRTSQHIRERSGGVVPEGIRNVQVDYTAGFDPVPPDLRQAAIQQVLHLWRSYPASGDARAGLTARTIRETSEQFIDDAIIPPRVMQVLDRYRRQDFINHRNLSSATGSTIR